MSLFSFLTDTVLEKDLKKQIRASLKTFEKQNPDPEGVFQSLFKIRPQQISLSQHLRLKILHQQFSKGTVPGLPVIVRGARFLYGHYRDLRKTRENA